MTEKFRKLTSLEDCEWELAQAVQLLQDVQPVLTYAEKVSVTPVIQNLSRELNHRVRQMVERLRREN